MKSIIKTISLIFILLVNCSVVAIERVPGTHISLDPPNGFKPTDRFNGYFHERASSTIMINELPASFNDISSEFIEQNLNSQGMTLVEKSELTIENHPALLLLVKQSATGDVFYKWILVFGDEKSTEMVVAVFPDQAPAGWSDRLKNTLLSIHWHKDLELDLFEGLQYRIEEQNELKIAKKMSNMLLLTKNGIMPSRPSVEPKVIISPSIKADWQEPEDKLKYTVNRLQQMTNLCDSPQTTSKNRVTYDSLDGYQLEASCRHFKTGEQLYLLHTMIYSEQGYYLMNASVNHQEKDTYLPIFKKIFGSFKRI